MSRHHHPQVPTTRDVLPGASVNIVLKQDQPTGRTVSGVVRDLLTRGNHPRGIKVRLADGRVGRVQSLASGEGKQGAEQTSESAQMVNWGSDTGREPDRDAGMIRERRGGRSRAEEDEVPPVQVGLDAYIKPAKQKRRRGKGASTEGSGVESGSVEQPVLGEDSDGGAPLEQKQETMARCPVCHDFEGDEAAVAHHVAGHFDA